MTATIPGTDHVSPDEFARLLVEEPDVRVFDVRTGPEFAAIHIPGSFNIPLPLLEEHVADLSGAAGPVVLVCQSGTRAVQAHRQLSGAHPGRLHILEGGIDHWEAVGGVVARGTSQVWAMDRQVRFTAGSLSLAGLLLGLVFPKARWLAGGVATGLVVSAVTNTCFMATVLGRLPFNRASATDAELEKTLAALRTGRSATPA